MENVSAEEGLFERVISYEDKDNLYHPDQIDKSSDIDFIKTSYRAMYDSRDFDRKNLAKNYLSEGKSLREEVKSLREEIKQLKDGST